MAGSERTPVAYIAIATSDDKHGDMGTAKRLQSHG